MSLSDDAAYPTVWTSEIVPLPGAYIGKTGAYRARYPVLVSTSQSQSLGQCHRTQAI